MKNLSNALTLNIVRTMRMTREYARAEIHGSNKFPDIKGSVYFYNLPQGTLVVASVMGLPEGTGNPCDSRIFAMHIHEGVECTGNSNDPFAAAGQHYNPLKCAHPYHAGDLPPLFSAGGIAWGAVLTNRFSTDDIINRVVIIHDMPDDFRSQPSGNSGSKIACGTILKV